MSAPDRPIPPRPQNVNARQAAAQPTPGPAGAGEQPAVEVPRVTFAIHALFDDFPIDVQFSGTADQLKATVARLKELGAVPPTPAARAAVAAEKAREAPRCEFHGPMKESTKAPGTWYCTKKMGDDSYCKSKA
jgi:hypothetical protein